jgi:hypothetical protein
VELLRADPKCSTWNIWSSRSRPREGCPITEFLTRDTPGRTIEENRRQRNLWMGLRERFSRRGPLSLFPKTLSLGLTAAPENSNPVGMRAQSSKNVPRGTFKERERTNVGSWVLSLEAEIPHSTMENLLSWYADAMQRNQRSTWNISCVPFSEERLDYGGGCRSLSDSTWSTGIDPILTQ